MWYPFFILGSGLFWSLTCVWLVILIICVEEEASGPAIWSVLLYLGLITVLGDADIWGYITTNLYSFMTGVLVYIVAGVLWAMCKLYFSSKAIGRKIRNIRLQCHGHDEENIQRNIRNKLSSKEHRRLNFEGCAGDIIFWMCYWPVSSIWTLLNDPIKRFFKYVY